MSFMRLGTRIAVINADNQILLSKRGDFGIWALPGGRVDSGELLADSAIREVREETGLEVEIVRPIGLYFQEGRSRINVLYQAKPIGGKLFTKSDETLDNRFFPQDNLPDDLFGKVYIDHAFSKQSYIHTLKSSRWDLLKLDLKLRWRWLQNLLSGRPEPKFVQFKVSVVGLVFDGRRKSILMMNDEFPRAMSDGKQHLSELISDTLFMGDIDWRWVGLWQDTANDSLEFAFESQDSFASNMFVPIADIPSEHDRKIITLSKKKSTKIWLSTE